MLTNQSVIRVPGEAFTEAGGFVISPRISPNNEAFLRLNEDTLELICKYHIAKFVKSEPRLCSLQTFQRLFQTTEIFNLLDESVCPRNHQSGIDAFRQSSGSETH